MASIHSFRILDVALLLNRMQSRMGSSHLVQVATIERIKGSLDKPYVHVVHLIKNHNANIVYKSVILVHGSDAQFKTSISSNVVF